ncbi:Flp family type IVb pilin [uncultured Roseibium sp.]|uniref:Flp family type IVb pilin n=1 Tax=uncultured Roseibium sp. TaxID=1936171 RepID=UPI003216775B
MTHVGKATGFFETELAASVQRFSRDETGAASVEYGMIVGMISVAIIATLTSIGVTIRDDIFGVISTAMSGGEAE